MPKKSSRSYKFLMPAVFTLVLLGAVLVLVSKPGNYGKADTLPEEGAANTGNLPCRVCEIRADIKKDAVALKRLEERVLVLLEDSEKAGIKMDKLQKVFGMVNNQLNAVYSFGHHLRLSFSILTPELEEIANQHGFNKLECTQTYTRMLQAVSDQREIVVLGSLKKINDAIVNIQTNPFFDNSSFSSPPFLISLQSAIEQFKQLGKNSDCSEEGKQEACGAVGMYLSIISNEISSELLQVKAFIESISSSDFSTEEIVAIKEKQDLIDELIPKLKTFCTEAIVSSPEEEQPHFDQILVTTFSFRYLEVERAEISIILHRTTQDLIREFREGFNEFVRIKQELEKIVEEIKVIEDCATIRNQDADRPV